MPMIFPRSAATRVVDFSAAAGYVVEIGEKIPVTIGIRYIISWFKAHKLAFDDTIGMKHWDSAARAALFA